LQDVLKLSPSFIGIIFLGPSLLSMVLSPVSGALTDRIGARFLLILGVLVLMAAFLIGAIAGVFVCVAYWIVDTKLKIDDPVGAFSVHGVNGLWGVLSLGLFADGTYGAGWIGIDGTVEGLFYGDAGQLGAQAIGVVTLIVWAFGGTFLFMKVQDMIQGIRVSPETEIAGLDIPEMGALGYGEDVPLTSPAGSG